MSDNSSVSLGKTPVLILWVVIAAAVAYTFYSFAYPYLQATKLGEAENAGYQKGYQAAVGVAMQTFSGNVFKNGYATAYGEIGQALFAQYKEGCKQAIPVNVGGSGAIGIVSIDCLAMAQSGATQPQEAATPNAQRPQAPAQR